LGSRTFKNEYIKQTFKTYSDEIKEIEKPELTFDNKSFHIYGVNGTLKVFFLKGILYPQLISSYTTDRRKSEKELDSLTVSQKYFYELTRGANLTITNLEELKYLSNSPKIRRLRFWLGRSNSANLQVYLFELTDETADKNTELKE
jgi:hypothetical protein